MKETEESREEYVTETQLDVTMISKAKLAMGCLTVTQLGRKGVQVTSWKPWVLLNQGSLLI